tara:strand:+ start:664 stop:945 length:282 start_codon:yes stop_codon:yes gene_type:complete
MKRLTLTDSDKQVRDWFVKTTQSLGCKVSIDAMGKSIFFFQTRNKSANFSSKGNIFAVRPGKKDGSPTYAGSHLDTQVIRAPPANNQPKDSRM